MIVASLSTEKLVVARGTLQVSPRWRDLTQSEWNQLHGWRACHGAEEAAGLQTAAFDENLPHDTSLRDVVERLRVDHGGRDLAVLYLHRGHQLDTRSPILQWLLHLLDINRNVFAIRVEHEQALEDAFSMARALLGAHAKVLILNDEVERIAERGRLANEVSYVVLEKERRDATATRRDPARSAQNHVREMSL
ncbi:hypothetical protein [Rhizobium sp. SYY.PMSO]|uniref:hypothetical protein n=1 Tax=Rhizobium sp. SYY.PMSO TaxID=3382192 RepID=UPI0039901532